MVPANWYMPIRRASGEYQMEYISFIYHNYRIALAGTRTYTDVAIRRVARMINRMQVNTPTTYHIISYHTFIALSLSIIHNNLQLQTVHAYYRYYRKLSHTFHISHMLSLGIYIYQVIDVLTKYQIVSMHSTQCRCLSVYRNRIPYTVYRNS